MTPGTDRGLPGLEIERGSLPGVSVLRPRRFADERGFFSETFSTAWLPHLGVDVGFIQDNHSCSVAAGTVRGFHFQAPPFAQAKLVRVSHGSALDVILDLRVGSPSYGRWQAVELSADAWNQVLVPVGCAHAFCSLQPDTHLLYKVSAPYRPEAEGGVLWNDPDLGVAWPAMERYMVSDRDRSLPRLDELSSPFVYGGGSSEGERP
jgi:dTDP-4-dehydrorhamnose 3,5-epimerase